jgi:hypothetical protein
MKIRQGFVSNSSSTSFCIYGLYVEGESEEQILENRKVPEGIEVNFGPDDGYGFEGLFLGVD